MKLVLLTCYIFCLSAIAGEEVRDTLYTYPIKGSIEPDKKTSYSKFLDHIVEHSNGQEIKNYPYKRSIHSFLNNKNSCLFPASKMQFQNYKKDIIFSNSLIDVNINVISYDQEKVANSLEDLQGKVLISLNQIYVPEVIKKSVQKIITVEQEDQAIKMLKNKRADFMLGPGIDMRKVYATEGITLNYNDKFIVATFYDRIACHNIKINKQRIEVFNKFLE